MNIKQSRIFVKMPNGEAVMDTFSNIFRNDYSGVGDLSIKY